MSFNALERRLIAAVFSDGIAELVLRGRTRPPKLLASFAELADLDGDADAADGAAAEVTLLAATLMLAQGLGTRRTLDRMLAASAFTAITVAHLGCCRRYPRCCAATRIEVSIPR